MNYPDLQRLMLTLLDAQESKNVKDYLQGITNTVFSGLWSD